MARHPSGCRDGRSSPSSVSGRSGSGWARLPSGRRRRAVGAGCAGLLEPVARPCGCRERRALLSSRRSNLIEEPRVRQMVVLISRPPSQIASSSPSTVHQGSISAAAQATAPSGWMSVVHVQQVEGVPNLRGAGSRDQLGRRHIDRMKTSSRIRRSGTAGKKRNSDPTTHSSSFYVGIADRHRTMGNGRRYQALASTMHTVERSSASSTSRADVSISAVERAKLVRVSVSFRMRSRVVASDLASRGHWLASAIPVAERSRRCLSLIAALAMVCVQQTISAPIRLRPMHMQPFARRARALQLVHCPVLSLALRARP